MDIRQFSVQKWVYDAVLSARRSLHIRTFDARKEQQNGFSLRKSPLATSDQNIVDFIQKFMYILKHSNALTPHCVTYDIFYLFGT